MVNRRCNQSANGFSKRAKWRGLPNLRKARALVRRGAEQKYVVWQNPWGDVIQGVEPMSRVVLREARR